MIQCSTPVTATLRWHQLQKQIYITQEWFVKWRLRINPTKNTAIIFTTKRYRNLLRLTINGTPISWFTHVKYLGITMSNTLGFGKHLHDISRKATRTRGLLYPLLNRRSLIPIKTRVNILKMYIIPILTYAGVAWAAYVTKSHWKRIESILTIGVRTILGTPSYVNNHTTLSTVGLSKIQAKAFFHKNKSSRHHHIRSLGQDPNQPLLSCKKKLRPVEWATS